MEERLQNAANEAETYAAYGGLQCSPQKSEYVHIKPSPKDDVKLNLRLSNGPICEVLEIRVLGLHIHQSQSANTTLQKLQKVGEQVGRMIRQVSNKRGGLKSKDAIRLEYASVTSRTLYSALYLNLRKCDKENIEITLRKTMKRVQDLLIITSNARLQALGMTNTFRELRGAPRQSVHPASTNRVRQTASKQNTYQSCIPHKKKDPGSRTLASVMWQLVVPLRTMLF